MNLSESKTCQNSLGYDESGNHGFILLRTITMTTRLIIQRSYYVLYLLQLMLNSSHHYDCLSHLKFIIHTSNPPSFELQCACVSTGGL